MSKQSNVNQNGERGIALITALMMSTILLALGMAVVFSATNDTVTTKVQRVSEQAFFAADAGVAIARRALGEALETEVEKIKKGQTQFYNKGGSKGFANVQAIPHYDANNPHQFYKNILTNAKQLARVEVRDTILKDFNGSRFDVSYQLLSCDISLSDPNVNDNVATEVVNLRYAIQVTGATEAGGTASIIESGRINLDINMQRGAGADPSRSFSFSGFGTFYDDGDTIASAALASGMYTGPVHTNTHFSFRSTNNVVFRNVVSQVDDYIRYNSNNFAQGHQSIPTADIQGIDISQEGYKKVPKVPLPPNVLSQEFAVINSSGITDLDDDGEPVDPPSVYNEGDPVFTGSGRVTVEALKANLRNAQNLEPTLTGGGTDLSDGVYLAADGNKNVTGGIYVEGDASDIQLYSIGTDQYYVIKQGSTTTTIQVSPTANQTTVTTGTKSTTFNGMPKDKSDPYNIKDGLCLFVDGNINSLRGGKDSSNNRRALAAGTRLTITAMRHITLTGDIKFTDPVIDSFGSPVSNLKDVVNVLGIFTNDGNVYTSPKSQYVSGPGLSMEVNAAIAAFNSNTSNDSGKIEGSFTYDTYGSTPGTNDVFALIGARAQSKANLTNYKKVNRFFDVRFSGGTFAPPFFPGTTYQLEDGSDAAEATIATIEDPRPIGMTWLRP